MDDKVIMDNILSTTKGACDLMMHGAIESSTPDVHCAFTQAFNDTLCMQNEIYKKNVSERLVSDAAGRAAENQCRETEIQRSVTEASFAAEPAQSQRPRGFHLFTTRADLQ